MKILVIILTLKQNNMKARVKATGDIYDIQCVSVRLTEKVLSTMSIDDVDVLMPDLTPDYWTRLEHTYVGMFMKSFLDNFDGTATMEQLSDDAIALAHALVEKMKEEKK